MMYHFPYSNFPKKNKLHWDSPGGTVDKNMWYIYTVEYYSAIKKNTFESVLMRWMKLEPIIQSKPERKTLIQYTNAYIWHLERC